MKTIGQLLKEARASKNYTLTKLENITRIRRDFIASIEEENWSSLPTFPTILGFVKSISSTLDVDENMAVSILKRDYPPKKLFINPKPDISSKFAWSPKLTFWFLAGAILLVIFGYLIFQYSRFLSPPSLLVETPTESQTIEKGTVLVSGSTDSDSKVTVNNQPVLIDDNGHFSVDLEVVTDTNEIVIKSVSRSGKITEVTRKIKVK